ncbi:MAG: hypothetical protein ACYTGW_11645 [Planctomycetota bacterium]|jgi:hypothetical protein
MRSILALSVLLVGCAGLPRQSHVLNPLGWPAKLLGSAGFAAADSGLPLLRETGRLLQAVGELSESPALLAEGLLTFDHELLGGSARQLVVGTGATVTSTYNLPFFVVPGSNIDLGRDAPIINEALAYMETLPVESWRFYPGDTREHVFPRGTRVRASGKNLIWTIPGRGETLQAAEGNVLWSFVQWAVGTNFPAQERSWGFVVRSRARWDRFRPGSRAETICHEFYHQQMQMREWLMGWTAIYWPAYLATFPFTGWSGHWAEMQGRHAAGVVDQALSGWRPKQRATTASRRSARADKRPDKHVTVGAWAAISQPGR